MTGDLKAFDFELRAALRGRTDVRPFVCDGSPLSCQALIVGANPATEVEFWKFWRPEADGFQRAEWEREYEARRKERGKRPRSNTRERLNRIASAATPVRCLETNVFAKASPAIADLGEPVDLSILGFLLRTVRPAVVLAHGNEARAALTGIISSLDAAPVLIESPHLRLVSYDTATSLGQQIRMSVLADNDS